MNQSLVPPGRTTRVLASRVLVLAPHADDDILGCGGLLAQLSDAGAAVHVLFLSDSGGGDELSDPGGDYARTRRDEAERALAVLGIHSSASLGLPDGRLALHLDQLVEALRAALFAMQPELVLSISPLEATADHQAAFAALHRLLSPLRRGSELDHALGSCEVLLYEINHPAFPDVLVDVSAEVERLRRAIAEHRSQLALHNYLEGAIGLRRFRTLSLPPEVSAAEGYRRLSIEDFRSHSLSSLIGRLGGVAELHVIDDGPMLSVVVRTKDRPQLFGEALASLARSSYRRLQVVVVNDGGDPPPIPDDFPFEIVQLTHQHSRGRAAAANAGVAAASGEYVAFLDDDDLVEREHFATLSSLVAAAGVRVAYSDAAVGVYELVGGEGWRQCERRLPYSRDFDPELLLFDNYIPFNTLLIERALFAEAGPFDEELEFFEDWDFLIRLARLTPFFHLPQVSCEYRHFRGSAHHVLGDRPHERADFLSQKAKVVERYRQLHSAPLLARVVDRLRAEEVAATEALGSSRGERDRMRRLVAEVEDRYHRTNGELVSVKGHRDQVLGELAERTATLVQVEGELSTLARNTAELTAARDRVEAELRAKISDDGDHLARLYAEIERLNQLISAMESTTAWRLHRRLEKLRGR